MELQYIFLRRRRTAALLHYR